MGMIGQVESSTVMQSAEAVKAQNVKNEKNTDTRKTGNYGKTVGEPKLSEKAQKYYEELKKKYSNMDFILVSEDKKLEAQAMASGFANPNKMIVLIDEDKVERMANDENYRKQYESIIQNAGAKMPQIQQGLAGTGANVKGYGMKVNDNGTASYFAVIDKSRAEQRARIDRKTAEKKEAKKADAKAAAKKKEAERIKDKKHADRADKEVDENQELRDKINEVDSDTITITASSVEELLKKVNDYLLEERSSYILTEEEQQVGQKFDFKL